jgi:hypothetical protein
MFQLRLREAEETYRTCMMYHESCKVVANVLAYFVLSTKVA